MAKLHEAQANMAYYGFRRAPEEDFSDDGTRFFMWVWDPENTGKSPFYFSKAGGYGSVYFSDHTWYNRQLNDEIKKRGYHLDDLNGVYKEYFTDEALGKIVAQLQEIRESSWFEDICPEFSTRGAIDKGFQVKDYNADKDHQRVMDIAKRANSDPEKMAKLATNMAKAIGDKEKMRSRWQAAIDIYGSDSPVAKAFEAQANDRGWHINIKPRSGDIDWSSLFESTIKENVNDESIYDAHAKYEKDQLNKKEEEDNQENFTFDEGSVKLATVVKESNERKYWNNFFDKLTESRGTYTGNIAECPCCGHTIRQDQFEDYTCEECGEFWDDDDLDWHPDGDEYEDGYDNRIIIDPLEQMSESTNLKEHKNPFAKTAADICRKLTKDIDFDNDDNAMKEAADRLVEFIDSMIEQSMDYFPVDAYEPDLYKIWEEHEKRHK